MDLPMEMLIDYMAYLNPEIKLLKRDTWVSGIRLMPDYGRLDPGCLYFIQSGTAIPASRRCPVVLACPKGAEPPVSPRDSIILHTEVPATVVFNELLGLQNLVRTWGQDVELSISRREGLQSLLDLSSRVFGNPIVIMTSAFKTLAATWEYETDDPAFKEMLELGYMTQETYSRLRAESCFELEQLTGETVLLEKGDALTAPMTLTAVTNDGSVAFFIVMLCSNTAYSHGVAQLYGYFLDKLRYYLQPAARSVDFQRNQFNHFIIDIIEGRVTAPRDIHDRNLFYPPAYTAEYNTVLISHESNSVMFLEHAMQNLSAIFPNVRQLLYENQIILHPDLGGSEARRADFLSTLEDYLMISRAWAGVSDTFVGMETLRESYRQARAALDFCRSFHGAERAEDMLGAQDRPHSRLLHYRDYHVYGVITGAERDPGVLDTIRRYDIDHGSDYYRILFVLLSFERSYTKAAEVLHMHRNNVIYHARRMGELFGLDLDDPGQRLRLLLLYRVDDLKAMKG